MRKLFYLLVATLSIASCKNLCHNEDCQNGGTCVKGECWCREGYKGEFCEIEVKPDGEELKLRGTYIGEITPVNSTTQIPNVIVEVSDANYTDATWDNMMTITIKADSTTSYRCQLGANSYISNELLKGGFKNDTLSITVFKASNNPHYVFKGVKQ